MNLREFLTQMEKEGEILHVRDQVSAVHEIPYLMKNFDVQGPILLFEKVKGFRSKVVGNVCGTRRRICSALGIHEDELYTKLTEAWQSGSEPKVIADGEVKETVEKEVDLTKFPFLKYFEKDAGPYITSAIVHARSPDRKVENVSIHRLQVLDRNHLAIRLVQRHLFKLWNLAKESGKDLDVAISIGVHPAVLLAASSPVPFGVSEFHVANSLMSNGLRLIECLSVEAHAPAEAELVLEGRISTTEEVAEGPFVDITGTYDIQRKQPLVEIIGVLHRKDYLYQGLLPSGAEHRLLMGLPHEVLIWESMSKAISKVHEVNLSAGGCGWLHAVVAIDKQVDGDGKNALLAAFAAHPSLKHVVVVDSDINVFDPSDVEWAIATRFQSSEDLVVIENARGSTLDSSANQDTGLTSKMGMDATRPLTKPREKFERARIPTSGSAKSILRTLQTK